MNILDKALFAAAEWRARAIQRLTPTLDYRNTPPMHAGTGAYNAVIDYRMRNRHAHGRSTAGTEDSMVGAYDRQQLRLEANDLRRTNEIGKAIGERFAEYAVWMGIYPRARTSSVEWNKIADDWWANVFVPTADVRHIQGVDLIALERMTISSRVYDGECGFVLLDNGQIQPVDAERIASPAKANSRCVEGIQTAASGQVIGYWICPRKDDGYVDREKAEYIPRENFIHCYRPSTLTQLRGIPDLAACTNKLRDYDETDVNVFNKIKRDAEQQFKMKRNLPGTERPRGFTTKTDSNSKDPQKVTQSEFGTVHWLQSDEEMEAFESKTPSSEYVPYLKHELQTIAASLGISYEILMLIFTEGSFSSQRAALIHNRHAFLLWHDWLVGSLMDRLYNWRIAKAMKHGEIPKAPVNPRTGISEWYLKVWTLPYFDWVDPEKQASADSAEIALGISSVTRVASNKGAERDDIFSEKQGDIKAAIQKANEINAEFPEAQVTWRDFMNNGAKGGAGAPALTQVPSGGGMPLNGGLPNE